MRLKKKVGHQRYKTESEEKPRQQMVSKEGIYRERSSCTLYFPKRSFQTTGKTGYFYQTQILGHCHINS